MDVEAVGTAILFEGIASKSCTITILAFALVLHSLGLLLHIILGDFYAWYFLQLSLCQWYEWLMNLRVLLMEGVQIHRRLTIVNRILLLVANDLN